MYNRGVGQLLPDPLVEVTDNFFGLPLTSVSTLSNKFVTNVVVKGKKGLLY